MTLKVKEGHKNRGRDPQSEGGTQKVIGGDPKSEGETQKVEEGHQKSP